MTFDEIKSITFGAARVEEKNGKIHFYRFTTGQEQMYQQRNADFYKKTFATAGVYLEFETDSEQLSFAVEVTPGSSRKFFTHSVYVNGTRIGELSGEFTGDERDKPFSGSFSLGNGMKHVKIYFPWTAASCLTSFSLDEGSQVIPVQKTKNILIFGDSITQGYDAFAPENSYASQLTARLSANAFNKAIGGETFCPELASLPDQMNPDLITVAYGTNDWSHCSREEFETNSFGFYRNLCNTYPGTPIFALAPIWRTNAEEQKPMGPLVEVRKCFERIAEECKQVTVLDGIDYLPHDSKYFSDLTLHPNDAGFQYYADGLWNKLKNHL